MARNLAGGQTAVVDSGVTAAVVGAAGAAVIAVIGAVSASASARIARQHEASLEERRAENTRTARHEADAEEASQVVETYRRPLLASAVDLEQRLGNILHRDFLTYLRVDSRKSAVALSSTMYRLAAYLGWRELLRRHLTYLDYRDDDQTRAVIRQLEQVSEKLASDDPALEPARSLMLWRDEQRAIGGLMIDDRGAGILGYETFAIRYDSTFAPWLDSFDHGLRRPGVVSLGGRLAAVQKELTQLIETLDPDYIYSRGPETASGRTAQRGPEK
jgi:hypothetical protein